MFQKNFYYVYRGRAVILFCAELYKDLFRILENNITNGIATYYLSHPRNTTVPVSIYRCHIYRGKSMCACKPLTAMISDGLCHLQISSENSHTEIHIILHRAFLYFSFILQLRYYRHVGKLYYLGI